MNEIVTAESFSLDQLYRELGDQTLGNPNGYASLALRHWFHAISEFDERSQECLPQQLSVILKRIADIPSIKFPAMPDDRFARILAHTAQAVERLIRDLNPRLRREHAIMPIYAAHEFDSASISWLSRLDGRTVREKLAGKPYLKAVRRRESFDTPENRLFKSFCQRLVELLQTRNDCFSPQEASTQILNSIENWLHSETAKEIGRWENFAPNNSLLQYLEYRRIWDGWQWLQALDEDSKFDWNCVRKNAA